jgi:hypothetical protein
MHPPARPPQQMQCRELVHSESQLTNEQIYSQIQNARCVTGTMSVQIVQFAGKCMTYNDATEWNVTHAILSNSLAVSSAETRLKRNEQVDAVMHEHGLVHIGWLRQASKLCPLSTLDLDTQRVRSYRAVTVLTWYLHSMITPIQSVPALAVDGASFIIRLGCCILWFCLARRVVMCQTCYIHNKSCAITPSWRTPSR